MLLDKHTKFKALMHVRQMSQEGDNPKASLGLPCGRLKIGLWNSLECISMAEQTSIFVQGWVREWKKMTIGS